MKDKSVNVYNQFGRFSFWLAVIGLLAYAVYFPQGIYYCFFCGVMSVALALTAKNNSPRAHFMGGFVIGLVDVGLSLMAFYGMYVLYSALRNPDTVSEINNFLAHYLSEYGISIETFSDMMR